MPAFPCSDPRLYLGPGQHRTGVGYGEIFLAWLWSNVTSVLSDSPHKGGCVSLQMMSGQSSYDCKLNSAFPQGAQSYQNNSVHICDAISSQHLYLSEN